MTMVQVQNLFLKSSCSLDSSVFQQNGDVERMNWVSIARRVSRLYKSAALTRCSTLSTTGEKMTSVSIPGWIIISVSWFSTVDGRFFVR